MEMLTSNSASQIIRAVEQGRQLQARGSALASLSLLINRCEDRIVTLAGSTAPTSPDKRGEAEALQNQSPYAMLKMQQNQPWFRLPPADESASAVESYREEISESTHTQAEDTHVRVTHAEDTHVRVRQAEDTHVRVTQAEDTHVVTQVSREVHNQVRPVQEVKIAHLVCWLQPVTRDSPDLSWKGVRSAAMDLLIGSCALCTLCCKLALHAALHTRHCTLRRTICAAHHALHNVLYGLAYCIQSR